MKRLAFTIAMCFVLTGCSIDPLETDVTPPVGSASGARSLSPLPPDRFEGEPTRIGFEPVNIKGGDFLQLMDFVFLPDTTDFLAVNRFGKVGYFQMETESDTATMLDFFQIPAVHTEGDCGARSIVLDPAFDSNGIFYVAYCIDDQYDVIKRFEMSVSDFSETVYSASNIAAVGDQRTDVSKNAIGTIAFAKDGAMFVSVGDRHRGKYAQEFVNESGKIMRIVPMKQRRTSGFSVPDGNMKDTGTNGSKLLYAFGFADPWKASFDRLGRYWVADRGGVSQEINVVTRVGENFGWPLADGRSCSAPPCSRTVQPVVSWDDSAAHRFILDDPLVRVPKEDRASWVGGEYVPDSYDRYASLLDNKMVYGDFYVGFVRGVTIDDFGNMASDKHLGHLPLVVAWRQTTDGYVYAGTMFDAGSDLDEQGKLWRAVPLP